MYSQNQKRRMLVDGGHLWRLSSPALCSCRATYSRLLRATSTYVLSISEEGDSMTSLGALSFLLRGKSSWGVLDLTALEHIKNLLLNLSLMRACQQLPQRLSYLLMLTVAKHSWMGAPRATRGRAENTALLQWNSRTCYDEMKLQENQVTVISRSRTIRYFFPFSFL